MNDTKAFGGAQLDAFFPVDEDIGSDSALLDNVVELLLAAGTRELAEVIMMVIPEAWQNADRMEPEKKAFYKSLGPLVETRFRCHVRVPSSILKSRIKGYPYP